VGTTKAQIDDGGVVVVEEEFRRAGRTLEARASQLATLLERHLEALGHERAVGRCDLARARQIKKLVATLGDVAVRIREAGFNLDETCSSYVDDVDRADRLLARNREREGGASMP
jgi:hypothetical protein